MYIKTNQYSVNSPYALDFTQPNMPHTDGV